MSHPPPSRQLSSEGFTERMSIRFSADERAILAREASELDMSVNGIIEAALAAHITDWPREERSTGHGIRAPSPVMVLQFTPSQARVIQRLTGGRKGAFSALIREALTARYGQWPGRPVATP